MPMQFQHLADYPEMNTTFMSENGLTRSFLRRHALSVAFAVCIAFMMDYIFSFSQECWIVLSAFLVSQTTKGTPFRQGMLIFITIVLAISASSLLVLVVHHFAIVYLVLSLVFMSCSFWTFLRRPLPGKTYFVTMIFAITMMITIFYPTHNFDEISYRVFDAAIGTFVGIACRFTVFPVKLDVEFSEGVLPILRALSGYAEDLSAPAHEAKQLTEKRLQVESALLYIYPSWIYEAGFNRGLRSGFRFFLINIERVTEILFSMNDLISRGMEPVIWRDLQPSIENAMKKNQELMVILQNYFNQGDIAQPASDFTSDMSQLETELHRIVPDNIEALSFSPSFLLITAFVRDMRDLREILLQLVTALPAQEKNK